MTESTIFGFKLHRKLILIFHSAIYREWFPLVSLQTKINQAHWRHVVFTGVSLLLNSAAAITEFHENYYSCMVLLDYPELQQNRCCMIVVNLWLLIVPWPFARGVSHVGQIFGYDQFSRDISRGYFTNRANFANTDTRSEMEFYAHRFSPGSNNTVLASTAD